MAIKDDIKSLLSKHNITLTSVVDQLNTINDESTTVQNLSNKLNRGTIKYSEVEQILNVIGYKIEFTPIEPIYTEAQYTQQLGRGTRMAGAVSGGIMASSVASGMGTLGLLGAGAVLNTGKMIELISKIVEAEFDKKYLEQTVQRVKNKGDVTEKQLLDIINMENKDKEGD